MRPWKAAFLRRLVPATCLAMAVVLGWVPCQALARESEPLHVRLDRHLAKSGLDQTAAVANDAQFLRRVHLDLWGVIPSSRAVRAFLADSSPDKRTAVIDRLLESPRFAMHMADLFDVMLMERHAQKHVKLDEWHRYLYESFLQNKPWNQLASDILAADGSDEKGRPGVRFYLARDGDPNRLTRNVGRIFFGVDLQCCQCHDHPLIGDYAQADYYGIYAFLNRGYVFTDPKKKVFYAEKAEGDVTFTSVFTEENGTTRPRLPGDVQLSEPQFLQGEDYEIPPENKQRGVPRYSRRERLAEMVRNQPRAAFNRNIANRLWAHMMGIGLVEPVDLHHIDNPPTHPRLLEMLALEFASMNYDIREFLRQLALSRTYQRATAAPDMPDGSLAAKELERLRQVVAARHAELDQKRAALHELEQAVSSWDQQISQLQSKFVASNKQVGETRKSKEKAQQKLVEIESKLAEKRQVATALSAAAESAQSAAKRLADDQRLVAAADTIADRAAKFGRESETLESAAAEARTAQQQTTSEWKQARATALDIVQQIEHLQAEREASLPPVRAAIDACITAETAWQAARQQLAAAEQLADLQADREQLVAARKQKAQAATDWVAAEQAVLQLAEKIAAQHSRQEKIVEDLAAAEQRRTAQQSRAAMVEQTLALITKAIEQTSQVADALQDDAEFQQAMQEFKSRQSTLQEEFAEAQQQQAAAQEAYAEAEQRAAQLREELAAWEKDKQQQSAQLAALTAELDELESEIADLVPRVQQNQAKRRQLAESEFLRARLTPQSPEQLAWSTMQACGVLQQQQQAVAEEVQKQLPAEAKGDEISDEIATKRQQMAPTILRDKLKGQVNAFVKLFGHGAGQPQGEFFATVDQALYFSNSGTVLGWLNPNGSNLIGRLSKLENPADIADELYISILSRPPAADEVTLVETYLAEREAEKVSALKEMAWALLSSVEFRFY